MLRGLRVCLDCVVIGGGVCREKVDEWGAIRRKRQMDLSWVLSEFVLEDARWGLVRW